MPIKKKYLGILRIEIEDLVEDIGILVEDYRKRQQRGEITNYVFLENLAVLYHEVSGVNSLVEVIDSINPDDYEDLDAMIEDIEGRIRTRVEKAHLAEPLYPLVKRKLEKVAEFVSRAQEWGR